MFHGYFLNPFAYLEIDPWSLIHPQFIFLNHCGTQCLIAWETACVDETILYRGESDTIQNRCWMMNLYQHVWISTKEQYIEILSYCNRNNNKLWTPSKMKWPYRVIDGNVNPDFRLMAKEGKKMNRQLGIIEKKVIFQ